MSKLTVIGGKKPQEENIFGYACVLQGETNQREAKQRHGRLKSTSDFEAVSK